MEIAWMQSHMVRAPLARILGLKEIFNLENENDPGNGEIINMVRTSASELDEVIRQIGAQTNSLNKGVRIIPA